MRPSVLPALFVTATALAAGPSIAHAALPTGVPAGLVQHGSYDVLVNGPQSRESHTRVLFWVTADRWRSSVRDVRTGRFETGALYDGTHTTYYSPGNGSESFDQYRHEAPPPLPGYTPAEAGRLIARKHATPSGTATVAGIPGVRYELADAPGSLTLTVTPGTFAPLERAFGGRAAQQRETMTATATDADPTALRSISATTLRATIARWRTASRPGRARG